MFSIYSSAFNLTKGGFNYAAVKQFSDFVGEDGEVVIAVNTSEDDTADRLWKESESLKNIRLIFTDFSYEDPDLDGKIKNAALQETTNDFKIGLDLDEYIPLWQLPIWQSMAASLQWSALDGFFIPTVDLHGSEDKISTIKAKWYLHKAGLFRGTVNFAKNPDGTHDISKSDSCELIDKDGNLANAEFIMPRHNSFDESLALLESGNVPFVVHTGYLDLQRRIKLNKEFWEKQWSVEGGKPAYVAKDIKDLDKPTVSHKIRIR